MNTVLPLRDLTPPMPANLLKCPPLDCLTRSEAVVALLVVGDDLAELKESFGGKVAAPSLRKFIRELENTPIMTLVFDGMCMSNVTSIGWLWHPKHACGILYDENDCAEYPSAIAINKTTSRHLASKLCALLKQQGYMPLNLEADDVTLHFGGIEKPDLIRALADGVFASESEILSPVEAATDWVERHTLKKSP